MTKTEKALLKVAATQAVKLAARSNPQVATIVNIVTYAYRIGVNIDRLNNRLRKRQAKIVLSQMKKQFGSYKAARQLAQAYVDRPVGSRALRARIAKAQTIARVMKPKTKRQRIHRGRRGPIL